MKMSKLSAKIFNYRHRVRRKNSIGAGKYLLALFLILVCFAVIVFLLFNYKKQERINVQTELEKSQDIGVYRWLQDFTYKNFEYCDSLQGNIVQKIYPRNLNYQLYDTTYYTVVFEALAESINKINILDSKTEDGVTTYQVEVVYTPYKLIADYDLTDEDKIKLKEIAKKLINGDIDNAESEIQIRDILINSYKTGIQNEKESSSNSFIIEMSDEEVGTQINIGGTEDFITRLLNNTNVLNNVQIIQEQMKQSVDEVLNGKLD